MVYHAATDWLELCSQEYKRVWLKKTEEKKLKEDATHLKVNLNSLEFLRYAMVSSWQADGQGNYMNGLGSYISSSAQTGAQASSEKHLT